MRVVTPTMTASVYWPWVGLFFLLCVGVASLVILMDEENDMLPRSKLVAAKIKTNTKILTLPKIEIKSIQASPFQSQLIALLSLNGIEHRVLVGQQLADEIWVKAIDANGVDILHQQQLHRYEWKPMGAAVALADHERQSVQALINLLSHEFHSSTQGLEVYSATQQGLSASLGLQNGDKVSMINGEPVYRPEDITRLLKNYHPKQILEFVGTRQGKSTSWMYQAQADD